MTWGDTQGITTYTQSNGPWSISQGTVTSGSSWNNTITIYVGPRQTASNVDPDIEAFRELVARHKATLKLWAAIQTAPRSPVRAQPRYRAPKGPIQSWRRFSMLKRLPSLHCGV